ncbi:MAG: dihydropteroate synthase-like protein [Promethearchaeati archaeon SRVP18_Atabeyarchaeia-1]
MKVLLVTGRLAERVVTESALQQSEVDFCVRVLPVSVAALLTPEFISRELKGEDLSDYDLIVVPGMVPGDTSIIERTVGVPAFKGTRYASDIPALFEALGKSELSKAKPADSILAQDLQHRTMAALEEAEHPEESVLKRPWNLVIGRERGKRLSVGRDFPMRVVAEILDAPTLTDDEILRTAKYYVESGAGIVDVGMRAKEPRPIDVKRIVSLLKSKLEVPISLDTLEPEDIDAGMDSGVDMVLSLNSSNIEKVKNLDNAPDVAAIVIPDRSEGMDQVSTSDQIRERTHALEKNVQNARQIGFKKIIADPIMDPLVSPGVVSSIISYNTFSQRHGDVPLMCGVGNVTELLDADSVGVNAVMAGIAEELGASLLLTTEGSPKTRGAVHELVLASQMMYLGRIRRTPPKDFGIDLLILKEKRSREVPYDAATEKAEKQLKILGAEQGPEPSLDPKGFFKIAVDRADGEIVVTHFEAGSKSPDIIVRGREPLPIRDTLTKTGLISTLQHSYYLGAEIEKAYIASQMNRSYCQDEELFEKDPEKRRSTTIRLLRAK